MNQTPNQATFKDFNLLPEVQQALDRLGFTTPTEIQEKAIPILLAKSKVDLHGQAQTGTGKTLAFGIPLLSRIDRKNKQTQAVIIAPTRELALQICDSIRPLAEAAGISIDAIYGGASIEGQMKNLRRGIQIVVGTPGRINDHLRRKTLLLNKVSTLVLDEADIMLDMGFKEEVDEILAFMPEDREIWLFSATVKSGINQIMSTHMKNTESVRVSKKQSIAATTKHYYCVVPMRNRLAALCRFIESAPHFYGFVFCQTKILTGEIAEQLLLRGYRVGALHGDMSQSQRNQVITRFKAKEITILVATDVAARGIDVANATHVVNYSLSEDQESYVHRTGRTGRAGREGIAITFINKGELRYIQALQRKFNLAIEPLDVPTRETIIAARMQEVEEYVHSIVERIAPEEIKLNKLVDELSEDQRKNALKQILFDKYLKSIYEEEEFSGTPALDHYQGGGSYDRNSSGLQEIYIPVGLEDGVDREEIFALLKDNNVSPDLIQRIRVIKRRAFMHIDPSKVSLVMDALNNKTLGGRRIRAAIAEQQDGGPRDGNRGGFNRGGRGGGRGGERPQRRRY
jgi:ATP-dependent RNA helicase DeaD